MPKKTPCWSLHFPSGWIFDRGIRCSFCIREEWVMVWVTWSTFYYFFVDIRYEKVTLPVNALLREEYCNIVEAWSNYRHFRANRPFLHWEGNAKNSLLSVLSWNWNKDLFQAIYCIEREDKVRNTVFRVDQHSQVSRFRLRYSFFLWSRRKRKQKINSFGMCLFFSALKLSCWLIDCYVWMPPSCQSNP